MVGWPHQEPRWERGLQDPKNTAELGVGHTLSSGDA